MNTREAIAERIIDQIVEDLRTRSYGLGKSWDSIDVDFQEEIKDDWRDIVKDELEGGLK